MCHSTSIEASLSAHAHGELLLSGFHERGVHANTQSGDEQREDKPRRALRAFQESCAGSK